MRGDAERMIVKPNCPYCNTPTNEYDIDFDAIRPKSKEGWWFPMILGRCFLCSECGEYFGIQIMPMSFKREVFEERFVVGLEDGEIRIRGRE